MNNPILAENETYTFADYLSWDGPERYELIDGEPVLLAAPSPSHQEISGAIYAQLWNYLEGKKKCKAYPAPLDVRLFEQEGDSPENVDTVVQPDITLVCDLSRLDGHGYRGAPDMLLEILSPSTRRYDRLTKLELYQRAGVKEYWIVNPEEQTAQVYLLDEHGLLRLREEYDRKGIAKVNSLDGCFIELSRVFPEE